MDKKIGYILLVVGALIVVSTLDFVKKTIHLNLGLSDWMVALIGGIIFIIGAYSVGGGRSKQSQEVPIYHGKNIVGYRRVK
ncbi:hypothetical protein KW805_01475 [Candidatus Pacearchaeota archaeon]|nr:hypothetical protein [Candidatus Pacearchaeota archaeon]